MIIQLHKILGKQSSLENTLTYQGRAYQIVRFAQCPQSEIVMFAMIKSGWFMVIFLLSLVHQCVNPNKPIMFSLLKVRYSHWSGYCN